VTGWTGAEGAHEEILTGIANFEAAKHKA